MNKFKKALKISLITLLVLSLAFVLVAYILWKDQTTYYVECVIDFINRPLPIIGVSIVIVGAFIYKCFVSTKYGKKALNEYQRKLDDTKRELADKEKQIDDVLHTFEVVLEENKELLGKYEEILKKSLEMSKNIKVQALANELKGEHYGEEETDCYTEEEKI